MLTHMGKLGLKIGILGGGQLARMLALKGAELGYTMHVLSARADDPAAQVVRDHSLGDPNKSEALRDFLTQVDVATFESEFLDAETLKAVTKILPVKIFPAPQTMGVLQDRLTQKQVLVANKIPTLPFVQVDHIADASQFLTTQKNGIVLKQRRFGYDGYGTFVIRKPEDLKAVFARLRGSAALLIAEPLCRFKRELAVTLVRSKSGEIVELPMVETKQENSRCLWVKGPLKHPKGKTLLTSLRNLLNVVDYVGAITFELFETKEGLVVNEVAPRVHNSAHYSLEALAVDQFAAHILAVAGAEIPPPVLRTKGFAMMNLLGKSTKKPTWTLPSDARLHWYGKSENRPGRKMGHLNALGSSPDDALKKVQRAERKFNL